ncbi:MAG: AMIN domain-containing protein [Deltaproteobacteria bacterium]|nr:AMIN domain-containing protein [Deltaproteobacteria bacterium]
MSRWTYFLKQSWISLLVGLLWVISNSNPAAAVAPEVLSEITVTHEKGQWHVVLTGPQSVAYRAIKVLNPLRLVVDLPNTLNEMHPQPFIVDDEVIGTITTAELIREPEPLTRVEIGLKQNVSYEITRQKKEIWVSLNMAEPVTEVKPLQAEPTVKSKDMKYYIKQEFATPKPPPKETILPSKPLEKSSLPSATKVLSIRQLKMDEELRYYIVANGSLADYVSFHLTNPPRLVVDLMGVESTEIEGSLSFKGPWVRKVRVGRYTTKVRLVFDLIPEQGLPYDIIAGKDRLVVSFRPGVSFPAR